MEKKPSLNTMQLKMSCFPLLMSRLFRRQILKISNVKQKKQYKINRLTSVFVTSRFSLWFGKTSERLLTCSTASEAAAKVALPPGQFLPVIGSKHAI